jgi:hypothetical protein
MYEEKDPSLMLSMLLSSPALQSTYDMSMSVLTLEMSAAESSDVRAAAVAVRSLTAATNASAEVRSLTGSDSEAVAEGDGERVAVVDNEGDGRVDGVAEGGGDGLAVMVPFDNVGRWVRLPVVELVTDSEADAVRV